MRDITDVILHKIMKTKKYIHIHIYNRIEFKQKWESPVRSQFFSMYNQVRLRKGRTREGSRGGRGGSSLGLKCCSVLCVVPRVRPQEAVGLAGAAQAPEVRDGHGHFGTGDPVVVVCGCPPRVKVHAQAAHRHVVDEGVGQRHLESLGGPLAVLVDAHAAQLAQLRVVEAGVQHVEAVGLGGGGGGGEAQGLVVAEGAAVEAVQRREAVGVQAAHVGGAAHRGHAVAQGCKHTEDGCWFFIHRLQRSRTHTNTHKYMYIMRPEFDFLSVSLARQCMCACSTPSHPS